MTDNNPTPDYAALRRLSPERLDELGELARRDDWHVKLVGSDIRLIIGDLRTALDTIEQQGREIERLKAIIANDCCYDFAQATGQNANDCPLPHHATEAELAAAREALINLGFAPETWEMLANPEFVRQLHESRAFFEAGGEGKTLAEIDAALAAGKAIKEETSERN